MKVAMELAILELRKRREDEGRKEVEMEEDKMEEEERRRRQEIFKRTKATVAEAIVRCREARLKRRWRFEAMKVAMELAILELRKKREDEGRKEVEMEEDKMRIVEWMKEAERNWDRSLRHFTDRRISIIGVNLNPKHQPEIKTIYDCGIRSNHFNGQISFWHKRT